uniref:Uncharacterized protein n=1 Tax=Anguilla anguilla TaxID=7936 RepID=A0A0E9US32_ANGAN
MGKGILCPLQDFDYDFEFQCGRAHPLKLLAKTLL